MSTTTFFPAAGANSPVDGAVERRPSSETWATLRAGTGTAVQVTVASWNIIAIMTTTTTDEWNRITRTIFGFDTSSIGTDIVSAGIFSVYGKASIDNFSQSFVIDRAVPASNNNLVIGDYDLSTWDQVEQATSRITIAAFNTGGYNDFTLNPTGIGNVNTGGLSWFGTRASSDFDNAEPTWSSNLGGSAEAWLADDSGTTRSPKLFVTHAASTFIPRAIIVT